MTETIKKHVLLDICLGEKSDKKMKIKFWVTDNLPCDVVLGSRFLWENCEQISLDDSTIYKYLKLNNVENNEDPDVQTCKHASLLTIKEK